MKGHESKLWTNIKPRFVQEPFIVVVSNVPCPESAGDVCKPEVGDLCTDCPRAFYPCYPIWEQECYQD